MVGALCVIAIAIGAPAVVLSLPANELAESINESRASHRYLPPEPESLTRAVGVRRT
jgi:hypothetical protein